MATLTYDPTEAQDGEFSADELDSLQVGEALQQQQEQLLAGKFKDAEDLEQAYIELQRKLGNPEERAQPEQQEIEQEYDQEEQQVVLDFLDRIWQESQDEYSEETLKQLEQMDSADLAQMYLDYRSTIEQNQEVPQLSQSDVQQLQGVVGGEENYGAMMQWAGQTLNEQEIAMYDAVMDRGDPLACFFAVQALASRFFDAQGYEGQLLTGSAPAGDQQGFRSQAELVRAMSDPRYDSDPAYRQDVADKLERSNLNF